MDYVPISPLYSSREKFNQKNNWYVAMQIILETVPETACF